MEPSFNRQSANQAVRDLEWVLTSSSLLAPAFAATETSHSIESESLDEFQNELDAFLHRESPHRDRYRVGRYFEQLILFYLKHVRKVEIVASGLQVQEGNRTIGELDFVFRDEHGQLQHWETAVKFYLHFPEEHTSGSHLIGPDPRDNFESKIQRLFGHQLPLSNKVFSDIAQRHAFVKGRVFYHPDFLPPETLPLDLSPDHLRSVWLYRRDLGWLSRLAGTETEVMAKIIQKPFWLSPDAAAATSHAISGERLVPVDQMEDLLREHFHESAKPRLVSLLARNAGEWCEFERVFVVSESWPHEVI